MNKKLWFYQIPIFYFLIVRTLNLVEVKWKIARYKMKKRYG